MDINQIVNGYLYPFLWDVVHAVGGSDSDVDNTYDFIEGLLSGDLGWIAMPLLFAPIALWLFAKDLTGKLDTAVQNGLSWLTDRIGQVTDWLLARITDVLNWASGAIAALYNWASDAIWGVYNWATARLNDLLNWVGSQLADLSGWITARLTDLVNWVSASITDLSNWLSARVNDAINWLSARLTDFSSWVFARIADLTNWLQSFVADLRTQLQPLFDLLQWWQGGGGDFLVHLAEHPDEVILDILAPRFISWLSQLIADNW